MKLRKQAPKAPLGVSGGAVPSDAKAPETVGVKPPRPAPTPPAPKPGQPAGSASPPKPPANAHEPPRPAPSATGSGDEKSVGELFFEVSEQVTVLVREEVELAKAEVTEKATRLLRGAAVGLVAGTFLLLALFLAMHGVAILLGDNLFGHRVWLGYLTEAATFILIGAGAGLYAYRALKKASPPVPEMAIEQAKEIRATLDSPKGT